MELSKFDFEDSFKSNMFITLWAIWKKINEVAFQGKSPNPPKAIHQIKAIS